MAWNGTKYPTNPSVAPKGDKSIVKDKFKFLNIQAQEQVSYKNDKGYVFFSGTIFKV